jgi:hypothetical protein
MKGLYIHYEDRYPKDTICRELFLHKEHNITDIKNILKKAYADSLKYNTDDNFLELIAINSDCEFSFIPAKKKERKLFTQNHDWGCFLYIMRNWGKQDIERIEAEDYKEQSLDKFMFKQHVYRFKSLLDFYLNYKEVKLKQKSRRVFVNELVTIQEPIHINKFINK